MDVCADLAELSCKFTGAVLSGASVGLQSATPLPLVIDSHVDLYSTDEVRRARQNLRSTLPERDRTSAALRRSVPGRRLYGHVPGNKALREVGFSGGMEPDHVPGLAGDRGLMRAGTAYCIAYMRALRRQANEEVV
jgi:hypothetical protein